MRKQCNVQIHRMAEELSALQLVRTWPTEEKKTTFFLTITLNPSFVPSLSIRMFSLFLTLFSPSTFLQECADKESQIERSRRERKAVEEELEKVSVKGSVKLQESSC